jgi:hypothetical protein
MVGRVRGRYRKRRQEFLISGSRLSAASVFEAGTSNHFSDFLDRPASYEQQPWHMTPQALNTLFLKP